VSAQPERHLRPVENQLAGAIVVSADGEPLGPLHDHTQRLEDEVSSLTRALRAEGVRYENLKRDKEAEAQRSEVWPAAVRVFDYWRQKTGRSKRTVFTLDRFEMIRPWLEKLGDSKAPAKERLAEAEALCKLAVDGIAFDHYVERAKNGTERHHTGFHLVFKEADQFEKRANSAPVERIREVIGNRSVKQAMAGKKAEPQQSLDQAQPTQ
jgi:hypothetical protein